VAGYLVRIAVKADEPFLWKMLYYAAHMDEEGADPASAKTNPDLNNYVESWSSRDGDLGVIATADGLNAGAAWIRIMPEPNPLSEYIPGATPELALAVDPQHIGAGAGSLILRALIELARSKYDAIALSVRANNPAKRLYDRFGFVTLKEITNRVGTRSHVMLLRL
jgi:ribosomal protein S18 acetylase RimI-like enzyme